MGIEILKKEIKSDETVSFAFKDTIKQYFIGITKCEIFISSKGMPITSLAMSAEALSKSRNVLSVKLNATPASGDNGTSHAMVTVLALTGTDDEDFRMSPSMSNNQTFPIPGNPSILIPSLTAFDLSFDDNGMHFLQEFEVETAAEQQPGNVAMLRAHAEMSELYKHKEHPNSFARGGIFAYAGMSENILCTMHTFSNKTPSITLESLAGLHGVFISSFALGFEPRIARPMRSFSFEADSTYGGPNNVSTLTCAVTPNAYFRPSDTWFKASVNLIEILD